VPDAALEPFELAKHVQRSGGALRLTPDMKLVVALGPRPAPGSTPLPGVKTKGRTGTYHSFVPGLPPTPGGDATRGRELLQEARKVLHGLATCARRE
jgi:transcription-repair coupling factor (superfamily II helicase)